MVNYNNPSVALLSNAIGVDAALQELQLMLADGCPWLEKVFGKVFIDQEYVGVNRRDNSRPYVYLADQEPLNVMPNDNLRAYSFFLVEDPAVYDEWIAFQNSQSGKYTISLLMWCNLKKIDPLRTERFGEELKLQLLNIIVKFSKMKVEATYESFQQVFKEFTIEEKYREFMKHPYYAVRIEGSLFVDVKPPYC